MVLAWCCWREFCSFRNCFPCRVQQLFHPVLRWVVGVLHCFPADRRRQQTASCKANVVRWILGCQGLLNYPINSGQLQIVKSAPVQSSLPFAPWSHRRQMPHHLIIPSSSFCTSCTRTIQNSLSRWSCKCYHLFLRQILSSRSSSDITHQKVHVSSTSNNSQYC